VHDDISILLTAAPLSTSTCEAFVGAAAAGGTVVFIGTVRDQTQGKAVVRLEFEAYAAMAVAEMHKIAAAALERFAVRRVAIHHRLGTLAVGEVPVVIAVSAAHRAAAFEACAFCIDTLKQTVPIWKKEVFEDGETWVAAHP
jgi:molybdopterin synthase catalytic subunit